MNHLLEIPAQKFTGKAYMINFFFWGVDALRMKEREKPGISKEQKNHMF